MHRAGKLLVWLYLSQIFLIMTFYVIYKDRFTQSPLIYLVLLTSIFAMLVGRGIGRLFYSKSSIPNLNDGLIKFSKQILFILAVVFVVSVLIRLIYMAGYLSNHNYSQIRGDLFDGVFAYPMWLIIVGRLGVLLLLVAMAYKVSRIYMFILLGCIFLSDVSVAGRGDFFTAIQVIFLVYIFENRLRFRVFVKFFFIFIFIILFLFLMSFYRSGGGNFFHFFDLLIGSYLVGPLIGILHADNLDGSFGFIRLLGLPLRSVGLDYFRPDFDFGSGYTNAYNGLAVIYGAAGIPGIFLIFFIYGLLTKIPLAIGSQRSVLIFVILAMFTLNLFRGYSLDWAFYWIFIFYISLISLISFVRISRRV